MCWAGAGARCAVEISARAGRQQERAKYDDRLSDRRERTVGKNTRTGTGPLSGGTANAAPYRPNLGLCER
jgi:hypothetical protein